MIIYNIVKCLHLFIWPILEARAEILQNISVKFWAMEFQKMLGRIFWKNWRHQKDISKLLINWPLERRALFYYVFKTIHRGTTPVSHTFLQKGFRFIMHLNNTLGLGFRLVYYYIGNAFYLVHTSYIVVLLWQNFWKEQQEKETFFCKGMLLPKKVLQIEYALKVLCTW